MAQELVPPESFVTFGQLLRHLRKRARLTLRELSIAAGYSEGHLANLERDARRPDLATVQARLLPALDLADAPVWATRLLELAASVNAPLPQPTLQATTVSPQAAPGSSAEQELLAARLFVPQPRLNVVPRPHLLAKLDGALRVPLTLVAAPAGAGKTTLLAAWLQHAQGPERVAWLALDADANDLTLFVRYLVAACQRILPHAGAATLALLPQAPRLPPAALLGPLLNDLTALTSPGLLVLDDAHALTAPPVHTALTFFVEHMPPRLHLVLASREDPPLPLARLRARGALVELRARDLRFTAVESAQFLRTTMGLSIDGDHADILAQRTEGWAAGLQLAALALHDRADHADVLADLSSTNRYIVDYLGDEVLDRLPAHLRAFLLQTAILDRLSAELCDAVLLGGPGGEQDVHLSQHPGAYSQAILDELERRHLFVVPLDAARRWYRYHHLFADVLRAKLRVEASPGQAATLYQRAARWHEAQGLFGEAIRYALAAGLVGEAVRVIEAHVATLIEQSAIEELTRWLALLPEATVWARPRLCLAQSMALLSTDAARCARYLDRAVELAEAAPTAADAAAAGQATWLDNVAATAILVRGFIACFSREYDRAVALLEQLLADTDPASAFVRGRALLLLGITGLLQGQLDPAERFFRMVLEPMERGEPPGPLEVEAAVSLGRILSVRGRLPEAAALYEHTLAKTQHLDVPVLGMLLLSLNETYYEWNDLTRAEQHLERGSDLSERLASIWWLIRADLARARLHLARGERLAAERMVRKANELGEALGAITVSPRPPPLGQVLLATGDIVTAELWSRRSGVQFDREPTLDTEHEYQLATRLLLARQQWGPARALAERLIVAAEAEGWVSSQIEAQLLLAVALQAQRQRMGARAAVARALDLGASGGYLRTFVDAGEPIAALLRELAAGGASSPHLRRVLAALPSLDSSAAPAGPPWQPPEQAQPLAEPLSERELEVLRLIAAGHANRAIAEALIIELGTVKRHVHSLLGKLDAPSRTAAVARARELGLI